MYIFTIDKQVGIHTDFKQKQTYIKDALITHINISR